MEKSLVITKEILTPMLARNFVSELGVLRMRVFAEFPYLYDGDLEYEENYLETYFKAKSALIGVVRADGKLIGMTSAVSLMEEEESFRRPFINEGHDPEEYFYFGESLLLPEYRSLGLGRWFMDIRLKKARALSYRYACFCRVVRSPDDPRRPQGYRDLDSFWSALGFSPMSLSTTYQWKELGEDAQSAKTMEFWRKEL